MYHRIAIAVAKEIERERSFVDMNQPHSVDWVLTKMVSSQGQLSKSNLQGGHEFEH